MQSNPLTLLLKSVPRVYFVIVVEPPVPVGWERSERMHRYQLHNASSTAVVDINKIVRHSTLVTRNLIAGILDP